MAATGCSTPATTFRRLHTASASPWRTPSGPYEKRADPLLKSIRQWWAPGHASVAPGIGGQAAAILPRLLSRPVRLQRLPGALTVGLDFGPEGVALCGRCEEAGRGWDACLPSVLALEHLVDVDFALLGPVPPSSCNPLPVQAAARRLDLVKDRQYFFWSTVEDLVRLRRAAALPGGERPGRRSGRM